MKRLQTQQELEARLENFGIICVSISILLIMLLLLITLGFIATNIICIYDNNNKNDYIMSNQNENETNNLKSIYYKHICFNNSNSKSYSYIIQQLDKFFEKSFCYDDIYTYNKFELHCRESISDSFEHYFIINSSKLIEFYNYCSNKYDDYGYKKSQPCIVFVYINKYLFDRQMFYKFPIILSVKNNFNKWIECGLFYKRDKKVLIEFQATITNGYCNSTSVF